VGRSHCEVGACSIPSSRAAYVGAWALPCEPLQVTTNPLRWVGGQRVCGRSSDQRQLGANRDATREGLRARMWRVETMVEPPAFGLVNRSGCLRRCAGLRIGGSNGMAGRSEQCRGRFFGSSSSPRGEVGTTRRSVPSSRWKPLGPSGPDGRKSEFESILFRQVFLVVEDNAVLRQTG